MSVDMPLLPNVHRTIPEYPLVAPYSHSIVLRDLNALNCKHRFFCARRRTVPPIHQKFALLNSKGNFDDLHRHYRRRNQNDGARQVRPVAMTD
jgi:hypothetical protein